MKNKKRCGCDYNTLSKEVGVGILDKGHVKAGFRSQCYYLPGLHIGAYTKILSMCILFVWSKTNVAETIKRTPTFVSSFPRPEKRSPGSVFNI